MDNLGEAQDVHKGTWTAPIGSHPAVTTQLPQMLALLRDTGMQRKIRATYFVEAWSLGVYPGAVEALERDGHEVAWHGYQHEVWGGLSAEEERDSFAKSWRAAAEAGIEYSGFRPPGGKINDRTWGLLKERGVSYVSPLGQFGIGQEGVVVLPFEWRAVDAFWYMEKFSAIRKEHGEQEDVLSPAEFKEWLMRRIDQAKETGGFLSILFHPFLQTSEEKFSVLEDVVKRIGMDEELWIAPCKEIAEWVSNHQESFVSWSTESE
jgi:peptidoglycan/xylan/chitin deacetylase (PgdA/CDA1 family)